MSTFAAGSFLSSCPQPRHFYQPSCCPLPTWWLYIWKHALYFYFQARETTDILLFLKVSVSLIHCAFFKKISWLMFFQVLLYLFRGVCFHQFKMCFIRRVLALVWQGKPEWETRLLQHHLVFISFNRGFFIGLIILISLLWALLIATHCFPQQGVQSYTGLVAWVSNWHNANCDICKPVLNIIYHLVCFWTFCCPLFVAKNDDRGFSPTWWLLL